MFRDILNGARHFLCGATLSILTAFGALAQDNCLLVVSSHAELEGAQAFSYQLGDDLNSEIRQSNNKFFAVIVRPADLEQGSVLLAELKRANKIPQDSFCVTGRSFGPNLSIEPTPDKDIEAATWFGKAAGFDLRSYGSPAVRFWAFILFWALILWLFLRRGLSGPTKKRSLMRSPDREALYPMEISEVLAVPGKAFEKGDTLLTFRRIRGLETKRIVAKEDGKTIEVRCEPGARFEQPDELIVVRHETAEDVKKQLRAFWQKIAGFALICVGIYGTALIVLELEKITWQSGIVGRRDLKWALGAGLALLGAWGLPKALRKRRATNDSVPKSPTVLATFVITTLFIGVLWVADHGYAVTDDADWLLLIFALTSVFGILPFAVFLLRRYGAKLKNTDAVILGSRRTFVADGVAMFIALFVFVMQWAEVQSVGSALTPSGHSKEILAVFSDVESDLAQRLPDLFGPDARDLRSARAAAEQIERDRKAVAEFEARQRLAQQARGQMQALLAQAADYWPKAIRRIENSNCSVHEHYLAPRGVQMNLSVLERSATSAQKYMECIQRYQRRNSEALIHNYNLIVRAYQKAAKTAFTTSEINRLRPADPQMLSSILEKDLVAPYRNGVLAYVKRNMTVAKRNTENQLREDARRRKVALRLMQDSLRLQRELDQHLRNALNPNFFNQSRNWTTGNPGTPLSEFEFTEDPDESIEASACQIDCSGGNSPSVGGGGEGQAAERAKAETEHREALARIRAHEAAEKAAVEERAAADALKTEDEAERARLAEERKIEIARIEAERVKAEEAAEAVAEAARIEAARVKAEKKAEKERIAAERERAEAARLKAQEKADGCYTPNNSCIRNESGWKDGKFFVRLRNECGGRIYLKYCVSNNKGGKSCEASGVQPGKRQVSPMYQAAENTSVSWIYTGSKRGVKDWVCSGKVSSWHD